MRTRCRRERGSTILYAIILAGTAGAIAIANLQVATSARTMEDRREDALRWKYVKAAAAALFETRIRTTPSSTPSSMTIEVGGEEYAVSVASTSVPKEYRLTISNAWYGTAYGVGTDPRGKHPFLYGLFVDGDADIKDNLTLGSATESSHAYFENAPQISTSDTHRVYGAVDYRPTSALSFDEMWSFSTNENRPKPEAISSIDYALLADRILTGAQTINGGSYSSAVNPAHVTMVNGIATVTGTFTGRVVIHSNAKIIIQGPLRAANAASKIVLIANDIEVTSGGAIDAFAYSTAKMDVKTTSAITWKGAISCHDYVQEGRMTIILDPLFYDRQELADFRVPRDTYGLD